MHGLRDYILQNIALISAATDSAGLPEEPVRLLFGRGGKAAGFENINIDFFPPLLYVTIYTGYTSEKLRQLCEVLESMFPGNPVLIQDRSVRPAEIRVAAGDVPEETTVTEAGLSFLLHPLRGQNPGFFPDMRTGRRLIEELLSESADAPVLNLFAYTCSLSVCALAAGAARVINIDKNRQSLEIGRRNHMLNSGASYGDMKNCAVFLPHDVFKSFGRLRRDGPYRLIIADPPPSQKGSFMLRTDYPRLIRRLPGMLAPGGRVMLTLNSPGWSWEDFETMVAESTQELEILRRIDPPADFAPAEDGRGLKILIAGQARTII